MSSWPRAVGLALSPIWPNHHLAHAALADLQRDEGRELHGAAVHALLHRGLARLAHPHHIVISPFRQFRADSAGAQFVDQIHPAGVAPEDLQPVVDNQYALDQQLRQVSLLGRKQRGPYGGELARRHHHPC
ncbi:hypothetical protein [Tepidiphilus baoligensis]|uniref:hypothetical protein n=1 Tax=Tepidiphilus baoligensis TaxID=2698687 RepID=UPI001F38EE64|nr:hypothetical protein [Tepidiphilus baoligensis]